MQDCFQAWAKTRLETHKPAKPDSMHFEVLSNRPPVRCSFFRPSLWTTHLAVCKFGHVCGHPSNRPGHIISTFTELDGTIYLVTALWSSWSKTGQNTMVSGFQIFPAIQQYQWQVFSSFPRTMARATQWIASTRRCAFATTQKQWNECLDRRFHREIFSVISKKHMVGKLGHEIGQKMCCKLVHTHIYIYTLSTVCKNVYP